MKFTAKEVVRGFSSMTYNIDGQQAQVKVVYMDTQLNAEHGGKGTRTDAKQCSSAEVIEAIANVNFPVICELDFEELATKGKTTLTVVAIRPMVDMKKAA